MSDEKNRIEALRWFTTAREDLSASLIMWENGKYSHACFLCQQAAEKAVKALFYFKDEDPWGHSIYKLINDLESVDSDFFGELSPLAPKGIMLDKLYIPTRYPDGLPDIVPSMAYTSENAGEAREGALAIINAAAKILGIEGERQ